MDAGIGGAIAEIVAREYVTHLPRMASLAHQHVQVAKSTRDGMAATTARTLDACGRVEEVAPVLGGVTISRQTPRYAEDAVPAAP